LARAIGRDQTASAEDSADGLVSLNALLDVWWNDGLTVYQIQQENFALVAGQASRTIGSGGNFNTTRPIKIVDGCFVRRNGTDSKVRVLENRAEYDAIPVKTTQGLPFALFYDPGMSTGTIYFYYVPDAADTIYLNSLKRLASLSALNTAVTLPPGYDQLIVDGLAIQLAPEYGLEAPASVLRSFAATRRVLEITNARVPVLETDPALLPRSAGYDINTDS
jgi:hypothetical protein